MSICFDCKKPDAVHCTIFYTYKDVEPKEFLMCYSCINECRKKYPNDIRDIVVVKNKFIPWKPNVRRFCFN